MRHLLFRSKGKRPNRDASDPSHWQNADSYPEWWIERSTLLLKLLSGTKLNAEVTSFSEYGCGPRKPFKKSLSQANDHRACHLLDLKPWDAEVIIANLDSAVYTGYPASTCGVLSGVVEYLRNPELSFRNLAGLHSYLLVSYCYADLRWTNSENASLAVQRLASRAALGWRNHFDLAQLVTMGSSFGYVCDAVHWRDQVLLLMARHGS
jgi:hypothetical protein